MGWRLRQCSRWQLVCTACAANGSPTDGSMFRFAFIPPCSAHRTHLTWRNTRRVRSTCPHGRHPFAVLSPRGCRHARSEPASTTTGCIPPCVALIVLLFLFSCLSLCCTCCNPELFTEGNTVYSYQYRRCSSQQVLHIPVDHLIAIALSKSSRLLTRLCLPRVVVKRLCLYSALLERR